MDAETLLAVSNLSVVFPTFRGPVHAVRDVSFSLKRGEILAIVGESGSGKSVSANAVMQILDHPGRIENGAILLNRPEGTVDIAAQKPDGAVMRAIRSRNIAMVFQEPMSALSPVHTCGFQAIEALTLADPTITKDQARARVVELFRQVQLPDPEALLDTYPIQLSGGQRQRVVIAMAIAKRPDILIADEPTTALDVTTQAEILRLLKQLQAEIGMSIMMITHDMGVVAQFAERVIVMRNGLVVESGPVEEILTNPAEAYTRQLVASTIRLESRSPIKPPPKTPAPGEKPVLEVWGVSKVYKIKNGFFAKEREVPALTDMNLVVYPGETLGIVGESGSGKSTLGRCILGTARATGGSIHYEPGDGRRIELVGYKRKPGDAIFLDLRMIFQDPWSSLNPRMTIGEIIAEPLRSLRPDLSAAERRDRVRSVMERVGLDPRVIERYPHAFSGGQRQRIVIARAVITDPKVIIADEATAALDVSLRAQVLDLLIGIQNDRGTAFLLITHDIATVRYFCDRVVVLQHGRIVEQGPVASVLDDPREAYTRKLIDSVPKPDPLNRQAIFNVVH